MSADLDRLLRDLGGPPAELDVARLRRGARQARTRRRRLATAAALALLVPAGLGLLRATRQPAVEFTDQPGRTPVTLVPFDARRDVRGDVAPLDDEAARREPTLLPAGLVRCEGPAAEGATVVTAYCDGAAVVARLARGPHGALPEVGDQVDIGDHIGYTAATGGRRELTVSDADSPADTHYRLTAPGDYRAETLADILASVPALGGTLDSYSAR